MYIIYQYILSVCDTLVELVHKRSNFTDTYPIELAIKDYIPVLPSPPIRTLFSLTSKKLR